MDHIVKTYIDSVIDLYKLLKHEIKTINLDNIRHFIGKKEKILEIHYYQEKIDKLLITPHILTLYFREIFNKVYDDCKSYIHIIKNKYKYKPDPFNYKKDEIEGLQKIIEDNEDKLDKSKESEEILQLGTFIINKYIEIVKLFNLIQSKTKSLQNVTKKRKRESENNFNNKIETPLNKINRNFASSMGVSSVKNLHRILVAKNVLKRSRMKHASNRVSNYMTRKLKPREKSQFSRAAASAPAAPAAAAAAPAAAPALPRLNDNI